MIIQNEIIKLSKNWYRHLGLQSPIIYQTSNHSFKVLYNWLGCCIFNAAKVNDDVKDNFGLSQIMSSDNSSCKNKDLLFIRFNFLYLISETQYKDIE